MQTEFYQIDPCEGVKRMRKHITENNWLIKMTKKLYLSLENQFHTFPGDKNNDEDKR